MVSGMFYTMTLRGRYWNRMETKRNWRNGAEHRPELDGNSWNLLETTVSYRTQARLTPTLTHVVTYVLVTSGAKDNVMSVQPWELLHLMFEWLSVPLQEFPSSARS